jgi:hypothetical protein
MNIEEAVVLVSEVLSQDLAMSSTAQDPEGEDG